MEEFVLRLYVVAVVGGVLGFMAIAVPYVFLLMWMTTRRRPSTRPPRVVVVPPEPPPMLPPMNYRDHCGGCGRSLREKP